jgi:hypothetical protein
MGDLSGRAVVRLSGLPGSFDYGRQQLANTTETTLVAAVATVRHELQSLTIANKDTVQHNFDVRETTGGTVRLTVTVPAGDTRHLDFPAGLPAAAVNTNWTVQMAEAVTTNQPVVCSSSYRTTA